jgi:hypothetical protein
MKTGKKIAVGLAAALVVSMIAAGAVSMVGALPDESLPFSAVVSDPIDVTMSEVVVTEFPVATPGGDPVEIPVSFTLTNNGPFDVIVEASSPGLSEGDKRILPECISIKGVPLAEIDTYIATLDAGGGSVVEFSAELTLQQGQETGSFAGPVDITFSL